MTARRTLVALGSATVFCLLPFINKAFHIDDVLFLHVAEQISRSAWNFYGFEINWRDTVEPIHAFTMNPPLNGYYLAAARTILGESEVALHLAYLVPAVLLVLGCASLARICGVSGAWAGAMMLATPAFLVSATSLMSDMLMASLYVWAVLLWIRGVDDGKWACLVGASLLALAAVMTRYFAVSLIPLLALYALMRGGHRRGYVLLLVVPVLGLILYDQYTMQRYGKPLFWKAVWFPGHAQQISGESLFARLVAGVTFLGGGVLLGGTFIPLTANRRSATIWLGIFVLLMLVVAYLPQPQGAARGDGAAWWRALQFAVFLCSGALLLGLTGLKAVRRQNAKDVLLAVWVLGTVGFCASVNWTVNVRSFLPALPPLCVILAETAGRWSDKRRRALIAAIGTSAAVGFAVVVSDVRWANSARRVARELCREALDSDTNLRFGGHWGFQYYMERGGARAIDWREDTFRIGDRIVVPDSNTGRFPFPSENLRLLRRIVTDPWLNVGTSASLQLMNARRGVGFYTSVWGALPYAITPRAVQGYHVFELRRGSREPEHRRSGLVPVGGQG